MKNWSKIVTRNVVPCQVHGRNGANVQSLAEVERALNFEAVSIKEMLMGIPVTKTLARLSRATNKLVRLGPSGPSGRNVASHVVVELERKLVNVSRVKPNNVPGHLS